MKYYSRYRWTILSFDYGCRTRVFYSYVLIRFCPKAWRHNTSLDTSELRSPNSEGSRQRLATDFATLEKDELLVILLNGIMGRLPSNRRNHS